MNGSAKDHKGSHNSDSVGLFYFTIMKQLRKEFDGIGEVRGFSFKQICETEKGFIYEKTGYNCKTWEVFKRIENTQYDCISYPKSASFGIWAWNVSSIEKAQDKLNSF